ncbi:MAG: bifunctional DNA-formamidopyrimidine glycosylase/DNA-(apurinic or apyrimidinic site) lyase [Propionibacteriaceae bacterium]|nr:bifunctional DNA-formamidopyrimidine glycosylase/DNA-(apurinic or apyrimidinic site) lyase [Propionibacteriaceae bacterium]
MPELPEVEVVRRGLESHLGGRCIRAVRVVHPRPVRSFGPGPEAFVGLLSGRRVEAVRRRGKYLWWVLGEDALVCHLGMSGQFRMHDPGEPEHRHTRMVFLLDDGREARFVDQRMFGGFEFVPGGAALPVAHIAPDPFDPAFDERGVAARLRGRATTVKRALLDQRLVSGIGNIYADETLWRERVHYDQPTAGLGPRKAVALLRAARAVMAEALEAGGTSFDELYVNVNGESGYFARDLQAYGREGLPCGRCGTPIRRESFMNRSSFYCPRCQRRR